MNRVMLCDNVFEPTLYKNHEVDGDIRVFLQSQYPTWPKTAHIYHAAVAQNCDVTPCDDATSERLGTLEGQFYVLVYPEGIETIIAIVALAVAAVAIGLSFLLRPSVNIKNQNNSSSNNELSDRQNKARPNERIPDIFGQVWSTPDLVQLPYKIFGADGVEREYFYGCIGRGAYRVDQIRDGDTPLELIDGESAEVYGPYTSPNSGDVPQVSIGEPIATPVYTVVRSNNVNGQTLFAPNANKVTGNENIFFTAPDLIETSGSIDFTKYFRAGQNITVGPSSNPYKGTYLALDVGPNAITLSKPADVNAAWSTLVGSSVNYTVTLTAQNQDGGWVGLGSSASGEFASAVIVDDSEAEQVWVNFVCQNGCYEIDSKGNQIALSATLQLEIQALDSAYNAVGDPVYYEATLTGSNVLRTTVGVTLQVPLPSKGRFQARARRLTNTDLRNNFQVVDQVQWRDLYAVSQTSGSLLGNGNLGIIDTTPGNPGSGNSGGPGWGNCGLQAGDGGNTLLGGSGKAGTVKVTATDDPAEYGSGADGSVVFDGISAVAGATLISPGLYELNRNVQYVDCLINRGVFFRTCVGAAGAIAPTEYTIKCTGTFRNKGIIKQSGTNGGNGTDATIAAGLGGSAGINYNPAVINSVGDGFGGVPFPGHSCNVGEDGAPAGTYYTGITCSGGTPGPYTTNTGTSGTSGNVGGGGGLGGSVFGGGGGGGGGAGWGGPFTCSARRFINEGQILLRGGSGGSGGKGYHGFAAFDYAYSGAGAGGGGSAGTGGNATIKHATKTFAYGTGDFGNVTTIQVVTLPTQDALVIKERKINCLVTRKVASITGGLTLNIPGTTMPWGFAGGINGAFDFGEHDGTAAITSPVTAGKTVKITQLGAISESIAAKNGIRTGAVELNGWGASGHVGDYEMGVDQGHSDPLVLDPGTATTYAYNNPANVFDGKDDTYADATYQHTHKYAGIVYNFGTLAASTPAGLVLRILSEVSAPISTLRSAGCWYTEDGGTTWIPRYNAAVRQKQWDEIVLTAGTDPNNVKVLFFMDSHDDIGHKIYRLMLDTNVPATVYTSDYPSIYMPDSQLSTLALCGAFTDTAGNVLQAIAIGKSDATFVVPASATKISLGINDNQFANNTGSISVNLSVIDAAVTFDPDTLIPSKNAADILCALALDPYIGGRTEAELDIVGIYGAVAQIRDYFGTDLCSQFSYTFDDYRVSFEESVADLAQAIFCTAYRRGNVLSLSFEKLTNNSVLLFNHRNKVPKTETRTVTFGTLNDNDGIELDYVDPNAPNYPNSDTTITLRFPEDGSAVNPKKVTLIGVRNNVQAKIAGWRLYQKVLYQNTAVQFDATQEAAFLILLDRILVADNTRPDTQDGEVEDQVVLELTLSQPVTFVGGHTYTGFFQLYDGSIEAIAVTAGSADNKVVLAGPPTLPFVYDRTKFANTTYTIVDDASAGTDAFLVAEKTPRDKMIYEVKAVNYDAHYYDHDTDFINGVIAENFHAGNASGYQDNSGGGYTVGGGGGGVTDPPDTNTTDPNATEFTVSVNGVVL